MTQTATTDRKPATSHDRAYRKPELVVLKDIGATAATTGPEADAATMVGS